VHVCVVMWCKWGEWDVLGMWWGGDIYRVLVG
jgi:hypothetical protein